MGVGVATQLASDTRGPASMLTNSTMMHRLLAPLQPLFIYHNATLIYSLILTRSTFDASEFKLVGRAPAASLMTFTAALPMGDFAGLDKTLIDVSDPKSPNYGQWLSQEDVLARVNPDADIRAEVRTWLEGAGASCIDWPSSLRCTAPASAVETAFKTQVSQYTQSGKTLFRVAPTASFTYPAQLSGKLLFVTSVFDFPTKRMRMGPGILAISEKGKATSITPPSASLRGVTAPAPAVDLIVTLETVQRMCECGVAGVYFGCQRGCAHPFIFAALSTSIWYLFITVASRPVPVLCDCSCCITLFLCSAIVRIVSPCTCALRLFVLYRAVSVCCTAAL